MTVGTLWRCAIVAAFCAVAVSVLKAPWNSALGTVPLFEQKPTPLFAATCALVIMSGFGGITACRPAYRIALFVAALVGAIGDARFAILFAAIAAWNLMERAPA